MFKFELGITVVEIVTGYTGIVTARVEFITGCNQYHVQPKLKGNAEFQEGRYFDETRLSELNEKIVKIPESKKYPGCDTLAPLK